MPNIRQVEMPLPPPCVHFVAHMEGNMVELGGLWTGEP